MLMRLEIQSSEVRRCFDQSLSLLRIKPQHSRSAETYRRAPNKSFCSWWWHSSNSDSITLLLIRINNHCDNFDRKYIENVDTAASAKRCAMLFVNERLCAFHFECPGRLRSETTGQTLRSISICLNNRIANQAMYHYGWILMHWDFLGGKSLPKSTRGVWKQACMDRFKIF